MDRCNYSNPNPTGSFLRLLLRGSQLCSVYWIFTTFTADQFIDFHSFSKVERSWIFLRFLPFTRCLKPHEFLWRSFRFAMFDLDLYFHLFLDNSWEYIYRYIRFIILVNLNLDLEFLCFTFCRSCWEVRQGIRSLILRVCQSKSIVLGFYFLWKSATLLCCSLFHVNAHCCPNKLKFFMMFSGTPFPISLSYRTFEFRHFTHKQNWYSLFSFTFLFW